MKDAVGLNKKEYKSVLRFGVHTFLELGKEYIFMVWCLLRLKDKFTFTFTLY